MEYLKQDGEIYKQVARELAVIVSFAGDELAPETKSEFRDAGVPPAWWPDIVPETSGISLCTSAGEPALR